MGETFLTYLEDAKKWQEGYFEDIKRWQRDLINAIHADSGNFSGQRSASGTLTTAREEALKGKLLESLHFIEMANRHDRIAKAYKETFQWIFHNPQLEHKPWASFIDFLEGDSALYWITGKAGSGKSTLMKFIYHDIRTFKHLAEWSQRREPLTAAFFFWNSGTNMQMSQLGLFRSLLFQLLKRCPALIPLVFPERWEVYSLFSNDHLGWSLQELRQAFRLLAKEEFPEERYCFFIDGLDEFNGDQSDLVDLLKEVSSSPYIKICVSSRPWNIFEDAFKHKPNLRLENLTYPDIKLLVDSEFQKNAGFIELEKLEPQYANNLIEAIVQKAAGVFLWVALVVRSLLAGFANGDRVCDLQRRLDSLPPDLEDLYEKMLNSLDPFYFEHASQYFRLVRASKEPPTLLCLSFADEEPDFVQTCKVQTLDDHQKLSRANIMKRRLNSRCKGLLEVSQAFASRHRRATLRKNSIKLERSEELTVQYLHRTVKDFLDSPRVWTRLVAATQNGYDPNLALSRSYLAQLKCMDPEGLEQTVFLGVIRSCLRHAYLAQERSGDGAVPVDLTPLLDELDRAATNLVNTPTFLELPFMQRYAASVHDRTGFPGPSWTCFLSSGANRPCTFLSLTVGLGFHSYVGNKVGQGCLQAHASGSWPLLADAVTMYGNLNLVFDWSTGPSAGMVKLLFDRGADPNQKLSTGTVWTLLLHNIESNPCMVHQRNKKPHVYSEVMSLFLQNGADLTSNWELFSSVAHNGVGNLIVAKVLQKMNTRRFRAFPWLYRKRLTKACIAAVQDEGSK